MAMTGLQDIIITTVTGSIYPALFRLLPLHLLRRAARPRAASLARRVESLARRAAKVEHTVTTTMTTMTTIHQGQTGEATDLIPATLDVPVPPLLAHTPLYPLFLRCAPRPRHRLRTTTTTQRVESLVRRAERPRDES